MLAHDVRPPAPRRMTRAEYHRLGELGFFRGERVQLIDGIVVRMSRIGPPHASLVTRLGERLTLLIGDRAEVRVQQPFLALDESEPEPDIAVVASGDYADAHPDRAYLLIEVAESSLAYDRETKGRLYAASGVPEYWVVDIAGRAVEVYRPVPHRSPTSSSRSAISSRDRSSRRAKTGRRSTI